MMWRRHQLGGDWAKVTDPHLLKFLSGADAQQGSYTRHGFSLLVATCLSLALVALAGPAWEKSAAGSFSAHHARVVVLDLSRSMLAEDIKPNRSAQSQFKLMDLLDKVEEGQVGLVAYAGRAFVIAPLSSDMETIKNLVPSLAPDIMPVSGSRTDEALLLAADLIRQAGFTVGKIILIADSANSKSVTVAAGLSDQGFSISVLGIGSEKGAPIPSGRGFIKDNTGQIVVSRLERKRLQALAKAGGGQFFMLRADNSELEELLAENKDDFVASQGADAALDTRWLDQGYWLLLLLLPLSLLLFRRGWIFVLPLFLLPYMADPLEAQTVAAEEPELTEQQLPTTAGLFWQSLWLNRDQRAEQALHSKTYERVLEGEVSARFRAEALYRSGAYAEAEELWQGLENSATDTRQQADAAYNLGNSLAAQNQLDDAIAAYARSLEIDPENEDAKANKQILEQLKEQQNQQGDEQQSDEENQEQEQSQDQEQQQQEQEQQQNQEDQEQQSEDESADAAENEEESAEAEKEPQPEPEADPGQAEEEPVELTQEEQWTEEDEQAKEQWLRRIPDDPGGLLRRKLNQEYKRRDRQAETNQPW